MSLPRALSAGAVSLLAAVALTTGIAPPSAAAIDTAPRSDTSVPRYALLGSLQIALPGLPPGQTPNLTVTGPNGFVARPTGPVTLKSRTPGWYTVTSTPSKGIRGVYVAVPAAVTVRVSSLRTALATLPYRFVSPPSAPRALRALSKGPGAAVVHWAPGSSPSTLDSTTATATPGSHRCTVNGPAEQQQCQIDGLTPSVSYTITVKTTNPAAVSPETRTVIRIRNCDAGLQVKDLSGCDFTRAESTLVGRDLSGGNLRNADLAGTNLSTANLSRADLRGSDLKGVTAIKTNFTSANLHQTRLYRANLTGATLAAADLSAADLRRAKLVLYGVGSPRVSLRGANLAAANLAFADLAWADLTRANLSSANLLHARLNSAILTSANLRSAWLTNSGLHGANLTSADLTGADLYGADADAIFTTWTNAILSGARWIDGENFCSTPSVGTCTITP